MTEIETLRIYVVWHPSFEHGSRFANALHSHFESLGMERDGVRLTVPVRVRSAAGAGGVPRPIDLNLAEHNVLFL